MMAAKKRVKPVIAKCIRLAGAVPAGVLLYRIALWDQLPKVRHGQNFWIVNSNDDWLFDTELTPKQLKTAFAVLKFRGLIKTEKHLFRSKVHAFVQLTDKAKEVLTSTAEEGPSGKSLEGPTGTAQDGPIPIEGELEGELKGVLEGESAVLTHPAHMAASSEKVTGEVEGEEDMKGLKSVNDLKSMGNASAVLNKPDGVWGLSLVWKERVSKITGAFVSLTAKEMGQLKTFQKHCPPGKAAVSWTPDLGPLAKV